MTLYDGERSAESEVMPVLLSRYFFFTTRSLNDGNLRGDLAGKAVGQ